MRMAIQPGYNRTGMSGRVTDNLNRYPGIDSDATESVTKIVDAPMLANPGLPAESLEQLDWP